MLGVGAAGGTTARPADPPTRRSTDPRTYRAHVCVSHVSKRFLIKCEIKHNCAVCKMREGMQQERRIEGERKRATVRDRRQKTTFTRKSEEI